MTKVTIFLIAGPICTYDTQLNNIEAVLEDLRLSLMDNKGIILPPNEKTAYFVPASAVVLIKVEKIS